MEYVVIDTNIIVSAFINSSGSPAGVLSTVILDEGIILCYNDDILSEYFKVLTREKFARYGFDMAEINGLLADIREFGNLVLPPKSTVLFQDEDDRIFYDTALACGAILVTGNVRHFPPEPFIMTAIDYIRLRG